MPALKSGLFYTLKKVRQTIKNAYGVTNGVTNGVTKCKKNILVNRYIMPKKTQKTAKNTR